MATGYDSEPFEEWSRLEQDLWSGMVEASGHSELWQDDTLMYYYDVAFNADKGDIEPEHRGAYMRALFDYVQEEYGFDMEVIYDWEAWREMYGGD